MTSVSERAGLQRRAGHSGRVLAALPAAGGTPPFRIWPTRRPTVFEVAYVDLFQHCGWATHLSRTLMRYQVAALPEWVL